MLIYMSMIESGEDEDLFKGLYLKYRKHMKYIAMQILGDEYLAEDAVHNAFLKIPLRLTFSVPFVIKPCFRVLLPRQISPRQESPTPNKLL